MNEVLIPKWISIVSFLVALLALFVGASLYITPGTFLPGIDFSRLEIKNLTDMWAARQVAIGAIILYSVIRKSSSMLEVALIAYFLMTFQDIFIGVVHKDSGLIIGTSFFCLVSVAMLVTLFKKKALGN